MAGVAAGESVTVAGRPERVAVARAFAAAVLGRQHPAGETVVLLVSELVTNSVRHSASGRPGRTVTVTVLSSGEVTRVQVTDLSGTTVPALRPGVASMEGGRGLHLVDALAARWGFEQDGGHTTTWFELQHG
jgi:anti-sigma regulatory factor (Ser/Thr protein kinase)